MENRVLNDNKNIILADGAMGTYYSIKSGKSSKGCELGNLEAPELIEEIHREYLESGARLIRTNTFAANTKSLELSIDEIINVVKEGYRLALNAVKEFKDANDIKENILIASSIGPIIDDIEYNEKIVAEYKVTIDAHMEMGSNIFLFETFSDTHYINLMTEYIKDKNPNAVVIASFAFSADGYTRHGLSLNSVISKLNSSVDIFGLNCGIGPTHMYNLINRFGKFINESSFKISVMPNAGYPVLENNRTVFTSSADYFAEITNKIATQYVSIIGGCCGTTPAHIDKLSTYLNLVEHKIEVISPPKIKLRNSIKTVTNNFANKLNSGDFPLLTEFAPPFHTDVSKLIDGAKLLKNAGNDIITVSDSPLARARMDSVITASRISREARVECLPHICCRDKNIIGLRSTILGAYSEGIRNILAVTGDIVPENDRGYIKPVFNVSSSNLMKIISDMNEEIFKEDPILIGGALNHSVLNKASEILKAERKVKNGCKFFLTQPVYDINDLDVIKEVRKFAKVLIGIMPIVSYRNCLYLKNEVPGFNISDDILKLFNEDMDRETASQVGLDLALNLAKELRPYADGFYLITPFNRSQLIYDLIKRLKEEGVIS